MRIKTIIWVFSLCLVVIPVLGQNKQINKDSTRKTEKIEQEILQLEEKGRQKALAGDTNWDDLTAEGAYMIQGDGTTMIYRKGQSLSSMPLKSFKMTEMIARVYGETVVVTGLSEVESETPQKKPFSFQMRFLNVWKKFDDGWKIIVSERTMVRPYGK